MDIERERDMTMIELVIHMYVIDLQPSPVPASIESRVEVDNSKMSDNSQDMQIKQVS